MMADKWEEVRLAAEENRYELVLSGQEISKRISSSGIDENLFQLQNLNFLEISKTSLASLSDDLGNLVNLNNLVLHSNLLTGLPAGLGNLTKLKTLDVSRNEIESLPDEILNLTQLQNVNLSSNKLPCLPDGFAPLKKLVFLDVSQNGFEEFPVVCSPEFIQLSEIRARANKIASIPPDINTLSSLKILDLEQNALQTVPAELGECAKLKDLNLKENKLKDRRLKKLVDQCHPKQVLEYVRSHCPKSNPEQNVKEGNKTKKPTKGKKKGKEEVEKVGDMMQVLHVTDETPVVVITEAVKNVRPYIICCIIRDLDLESGLNFKKFIALQTRLHEEECSHRKLATIATHDLEKIGEKITFDARPPEEIKLIPLMHQKELTAAELYDQLKKEAETLRKVKNRNTYSGIHKYLYLLDGKTVYPCLVNNSEVISFPPITNSDVTKISHSTKHVFVEITSSTSLAACKKIMDQLLLGTLRLAISKSSKPKETNENDCLDEVAAPAPKQLLVEQVKTVDEIGQLRAVYPSRTDLIWDDVNIIRNFE